MEPEALEWL